MNYKTYIVLGILLVVAIVWPRAEVDYAEQPPEVRTGMRQAAITELNEAIKEVNRRLQYAIALNDQRAIEKYSPMAYRVNRIRQRMQEARGFLKQSDPTFDLAEIREIRAALAKGR